jgi:hypothetical protein
VAPTFNTLTARTGSSDGGVGEQATNNTETANKGGAKKRNMGIPEN